MKVRCFGIARDIADTDQIEIENSSGLTSVALLKEWLRISYPELKKLNSFMVAVNQEYATDDQEIGIHDEIAIIPPVSGG